MENAINTLRIQNFKSIKDATMNPRRVNLIIGQPNVGKSNILEAMSLLGGMVYSKSSKFMNGFIRYNETQQMFYDNLIFNKIKVETNNDVCLLGPVGNNLSFTALYMKLEVWNGFKEVYTEVEAMSDVDVISETLNYFGGYTDLLAESGKKIPDYISVYIKEYGKMFVGSHNKDGRIGDPKHINNVFIRYYKFDKQEGLNKVYQTKYLEPPHGNNLKQIIQVYKRLREEIAGFLASNGQKLLLNMGDNRIEVIKDLDGIIYSYPYSSIADTLQRIIFYLAAIESNDDSVLLFEEPEAHQFPVYTSMLGRKIVESRNNQFFIATHSPYLVTEILEQMVPYENQLSELAIFLAYYEDYQTKIKQLSDEEVKDIRADGIDIFYNLSRFTPGSNLYA